MDWFRRLPPFEEDQSQERTFFNHPYNPIGSALFHLAENDLALNKKVKSQENIESTALEYHIALRRLFKMFLATEPHLPNDLNAQQTQRLKVKLPKYYELQLKQKTENYFLVKSLHVD